MYLRTLSTLAAAALLGACGGNDDTTPTTPPAGGGPSSGRITLRGDGTFGAPHGGQRIRAALVRASDGATLDLQRGTVASADPAFVLTFAPVVDLSAAYQVRYWADHDSDDACDPPPTDHQWQVPVPAGAALVAVAHNASFTNVCGTFTYPLTFRGNTTFNGPHAGNAWRAALVKGGDATALEVKAGTVAAAGVDPAFAVTFATPLVIGESYSVKLWMDLDASGACEAPPTDHQWSVSLPRDLSEIQPTFVYAHDASFTNVCAFLP